MKLETLNTVIKSVDTLFIIGATSTSITLSITGVGLSILPKSDVVACTLSIRNKVYYKIITKKT